jgi:hypothetical protein
VLHGPYWLSSIEPRSDYNNVEKSANPTRGLETTAALHLSTLPVSFGLLAFVFAGHAVFPAIYTSMVGSEGCTFVE